MITILGIITASVGAIVVVGAIVYLILLAQEFNH